MDGAYRGRRAGVNGQQKCRLQVLTRRALTTKQQGEHPCYINQ
jgi:hypothetical protein